MFSNQNIKVNLNMDITFKMHVQVTDKIINYIYSCLGDTGFGSI